LLKLLLQHLFPIIQDDHTVTRIPARPPHKIGLMTAERRRQAVASAKEINRACLPVILREYAAVLSLLRFDSSPRLCRHCGHLFPTKLICVMLWQGCAHVTMLGARHLKRQRVQVRNKTIDWKYRDNDRCKPCASGQQQYQDGRS